jgi:hypothetical protein
MNMLIFKGIIIKRYKIQKIWFSSILLGLLVLILFSSTNESLNANTTSPDLAFERVTDKVNLNYITSSKAIEPNLGVSFVDNEGVYASDVNQDNWTDLLALGGTTPRLFINNQGKFVPSQSMPEFHQKYNGALFVDYDSDADRDLILVPQTGSLQLLENRQGSFTKHSSPPKPFLDSGMGLTAGDFNRDQCPDIFVFQYGPGYETDALKQKRYRLGAQYRKMSSDNGDRNYLLKGNCKGDYKLSKKTVFQRNHWSLAASFIDFNEDGQQDIHVANDFYNDSLYINQGNGEWTHRYLGSVTDRNGMSSQITDFNQDGFPDIFVSNILVERKTKIFNYRYFTAKVTVNPNGHNALVNAFNQESNQDFVDRAEQLNVRKGGWGWAAAWSDFNNDFSMELFQCLQNYLSLPFMKRQISDAAGLDRFVEIYYDDKKIPERAKRRADYYEELKYWVGYPSLWIKSSESSRTFQHYTGNRVGLHRLNARGVSSLDYDRDGDLDLAISQFSGQLELYENHLEESKAKKNNSIIIRVKHPEFGGKIRATLNDRSLYRHLSARTDFASQEPSTLIVGMGKSIQLDSVRITRPAYQETFRNLESGSTVLVNEESAGIQIPQ